MSGRTGPAPAAATATGGATPRTPEATAAWLLCALPREARALGWRQAVVGQGCAIGPRARVHVTGAGPEAALAATNALAPGMGEHSVLVGIGVAGALGPQWNAGDIILADRLVARSDGTERTLDTKATGLVRKALEQAGLRVHLGLLLSTDEVLSDAAQKAAVAAEWPDAAAVDMESGAYALRAAQHDVPFVALRIIVDHHDMSIPPAALSSLGANGETNLFSLLGALLLAPAQLGALLRLGKAWQQAREQLAACGRVFAQLEQ